MQTRPGCNSDDDKATGHNHNKLSNYQTFRQISFSHAGKTTGYKI